jgi:hypothetical protein
MCANKVTTTNHHLIGTIVRGYVAQSTGRIGLSNKTKFGIALPRRTRATAWVLNESTYEKKYGAHTQSNKATTTYHHIALIGKGITTAYTDFGGHLFLLMGSSCAAETIFGFL